MQTKHDAGADQSEKQRIAFSEPQPRPVKDEAPMVEASPPLPLPPRALAKWEKEFVCECVDVLLQLCHLYGFDVDGYSTRSTKRHWMLLASYHVNAMKFVKTKIAAFYSRWKDQELPPIQHPTNIDNPGILLGGRCYRWQTLLRETEPERWESFLTSVLYSKKGMPRPNDELLAKAEESTFRALTTAQPVKAGKTLVDWSDVERYPDSVPVTLTRNIVRAQLRRTVEEIYAGHRISREDFIRPMFPSTSANYINSRAKGGAVGVILRHPSLLQGLKTSDHLVTMTAAGRGRSVRRVVDSKPLFSQYEQLFDRMIAEAVESEENVAVPLALPESLKVRVITKGPPVRATVLKGLQKYLWRRLRRNPAASLIGMPVSARFVQDRLGKCLRTNHKYLSVDYEAATDMLNSWVSEEVANAISDVIGLDEVDPRLRDLFLDSLTRHTLELSSTKQRAQQVNGQLMGSITSFPLLCIANLAICRWSLEIDSCKLMKLRDAPLAVNGDDAVMKCSELGRGVWSTVSSYCGLKPSVGKVYYSRSFLNINSTTYEFSEDFPYKYVEELRREKDGSFTDVTRLEYFREVLYVNLGLLKGLKRSGGKISTADIALDVGGLGARARDLVTHCPEFLRERVLGSFIHHNAELLKLARVPWFLPERLGGLGLPSVGRFAPDNRELRLARKVLESNTRVPSKPVSAPWKVWQYATERYRQMSKDSRLSYDMIYEFSAVEHDSSPEDAFEGLSSEQTLLGLLCVEALFRVNGIKQLYSEKTQATGYLRKLQKMWSKVRLGTYPEPLNLDTLPAVIDTSGLNLNTSFLDENMMTLRALDALRTAL